MNLIDPDPVRAFRTVAVGVLVRVLAGEAGKGDAATDVVLTRRESATDQQREAGANCEAEEGVDERGHATLPGLCTAALAAPVAADLPARQRRTAGSPGSRS